MMMPSVGAIDELESMVDGTYVASDSVGDPMEDNPSTATTRLFIQKQPEWALVEQGWRQMALCVRDHSNHPN